MGESIRAKRVGEGGEEEYLVRWKGCTWEEDSWEPMATELGEALVKDFEARGGGWNPHHPPHPPPHHPPHHPRTPPIPTFALAPPPDQVREERREAMLAKSTKGKAQNMTQKSAKRKGSSFLRF